MKQITVYVIIFIHSLFNRIFYLKKIILIYTLPYNHFFFKPATFSHKKVTIRPLSRKCTHTRGKKRKDTLWNHFSPGNEPSLVPRRLHSHWAAGAIVVVLPQQHQSGGWSLLKHLSCWPEYGYSTRYSHAQIAQLPLGFFFMQRAISPLD